MATNQQTTVIEQPHTLDSDEKLALQGRIIKTMDQKDELADELTAKTAQYKSDKADIESRDKILDAKLKKLRSENKIGVEMRSYACNIHRDRDSRKVQYVVIDGPLAGHVIKEHDFTQEDWEAVLAPTQGDLFADEPTDNEPQDLRSQADLTAEPELTPNVDEMGNYIAGPETDAYNLANPGDTTYQHLSQHIDFEPVIPQFQQDGTEPTDAADVDRDDENDLGTPHDEKGDDDSDEDEEDGDDDGDDDEPETPKTPTPKRPARRRPGTPKE